MSQQDTSRMLFAIEWANRKVAEVGLEGAVAVLYSVFGEVILVDRRGKVLDWIACEYNSHLVLPACMVLVARLEDNLEEGPVFLA